MPIDASTNLVVKPYKREIIEEELQSFESWVQACTLDTTRWWAMVFRSGHGPSGEGTVS